MASHPIPDLTQPCFNVVGEVLFSLGRDSLIRSVNSRFHELLFYDQEEVLGRPFRDLCRPLAGEEPLLHFLRSGDSSWLEQGEDQWTETANATLIDSQGEELVGLVRAQRLHDEAGRIVGLFLAVQTQRKYERCLHQLRENRLGAMSLMQELRALNQYQEDRIEELLAATEEIGGGNYHTVLNLGDEEDHFFYLAKGVDQMQQMIRGQMDQLLLSRQYLEDIVESLAESVIVLDAEFKISMVNTAAQGLIKRGADELAGQPIDDYLECQFSAITEQPSPEDCVLIDGHGDRLMVAMTVARVGVEEMEWVIGCHEVGTKRLLELREQQLAYENGINEMRASVLHNIGNTIGAAGVGMQLVMDSLNEMLEIGPALSEVQQKALQEMEQQQWTPGPAAQQLIDAVGAIEGYLGEMVGDRIVANLEDADRAVQQTKDILLAQKNLKVGGGAHFVEIFDPVEALRDALLLYRSRLKSRTIEAVLESQEPPGEVHLPRSQLMQLIGNLIKNAMESVEERQRQQPQFAGGEIRLEISSDGSKMWKVVVRDNGMGIDREHLQQILQFGYTTKSTGSGIGLHWSRRFVNSLAGRFEIESEGEYCGAVVTINLPRKVRQIKE